MIILTSMLKEPGELSKFQALYALYSGSMYAAAYKILNQVEDAEDAVQLSLIKVIRNLDRVTAEEMSDIRTKNFLMTITRNTERDRSSRFPARKSKWRLRRLRPAQRRFSLTGYL